MTGASFPSSEPLECDAAAVNARHGKIDAGEIAIGVIIGRTSEFFDFFVYAIASVVVFPKLVFPYADPLDGTLLSFAVFALAFVARPFGTALFIAIDRRFGRGTKLTGALLLLGTSTVAVAFLPQPCPGLVAEGGLFREEVVHGLGTAGEQRDDAEALPFV